MKRISAKRSGSCHLPEKKKGPDARTFISNCHVNPVKNKQRRYCGFPGDPASSIGSNATRKPM